MVFFSPPLLRLYKGIEVKNVQQQQQEQNQSLKTVRNYLLSVFFPSSKHQRTVEEEEEEEATRRHAMPFWQQVAILFATLICLHQEKTQKPH
jgi:hypothetical protein